MQPRFDPAEEARKKAEALKRSDEQEMWARYTYNAHFQRGYQPWKPINGLPPAQDDPLGAIIGADNLPGKLDPDLVYGREGTAARICVKDKGLTLYTAPKNDEEFEEFYEQIIQTLALEMGCSSITIDFPEIDPSDSSTRDKVLKNLNKLLKKAEKYKQEVELGSNTMKMLGLCEASLFNPSQKTEADNILHRLQVLEAKHSEALNSDPQYQAIRQEIEGKKAREKQEAEHKKLIDNSDKAITQFTEAEKALRQALVPAASDDLFNYNQVKTELQNFEKAINQAANEINAILKSINDPNSNVTPAMLDEYQAKLEAIEVKQEVIQASVDGVQEIHSQLFKSATKQAKDEFFAKAGEDRTPEVNEETARRNLAQIKKPVEFAAVNLEKRLNDLNAKIAERRGVQRPRPGQRIPE